VSAMVHVWHGASSWADGRSTGEPPEAGSGRFGGKPARRSVPIITSSCQASWAWRLHRGAGAAKIPFALALEPARHLGAPSTPAATGSRTSAAASGTPWRAGAAPLLLGHEQILLLRLAGVAEVGLCDPLEDVAKYDLNI
jgi:hypothetical protein